MLQHIYRPPSPVLASLRLAQSWSPSKVTQVEDDFSNEIQGITKPLEKWVSQQRGKKKLHEQQWWSRKLQKSVLQKAANKLAKLSESTISELWKLAKSLILSEKFLVKEKQQQLHLSKKALCLSNLSWFHPPKLPFKMKKN